MTTGIIRCLLCDLTGVQFRRLKPENVYVCVGCLKQHGPAERILNHLPEYVAVFRARHGDKVLA